MVSEIVGRDVELASLCAFVDGDEADGRNALVLEGEAGIGKSTLWLAAVAHARAQGLRVLASRPSEPEGGLAHVALGDLFEPVVDEVLHDLPAPRRRALEVALLREDATDEPVASRTVAVAVRDALQLLSERCPTLVAVDDVQWLDPASAHALSFALRRLDSSAVSVLLAERQTEGARQSELVQRLGRERVRRVVVGPLSVGALHRFLRDRLGAAFPRQTLLRIHEHSGGNPFFALELARVLPAHVDPLRPPPVPDTLDDLVRARLDALPARTRKALAVAAALGTASESLLEQAGVPPDALEPALEARIIERDDAVIRFTHPLLSSVLYGDLGHERSRVHARIAEIAEDPIVRARHLALATDAPDAEVSRVLDDAAELAAGRGASAVTAELAEQALRLTPPRRRDERHRRALAAARAQLAAGEWTRARSITTDLLAEVDEGALRAEALLLLAEFEHDDLAVPVLEEALAHAASDRRLEARIRISLGWAQRFRNGFDSALAATRAALELAEGAGDDALRFEALAHVTTLASLVGDPGAASAAAQARDLAAATGDERLRRRAQVLRSGAFMPCGDTEAARADLEAAHEEWCERDELFAAHLLWELSWIEFWAGRWATASECAERAREIHLQYGVERNQDYMPSAWIALHRGELDRAQQDAEHALELCEEQIGFHPPLLQAVPGIVALWRGDAATAVESLAEADRQSQALGWRAAGARPWTPELVEALLQLDRPDEAAAVLQRWESDATRVDNDYILAPLTRCHGLAAAARGAVAEAVTLLEEAVARHAALGDTFGQARAQLALGATLRRARQRRLARETIEAALEGFEELGATTWIERAREELGRISGRTRQDALTAAERRVAALVAEGRTNHEVATALFLAERTVASHLTHIYAKLGVRSRTELASKAQTF
ncbi:MAG: AAA family ATPase [Actinomycetota bacterium]